MNIVLINPNLIVQSNDRFTTGVIYMPIGLAYVAAVMRSNNMPVTVIDSFGESPRQARLNNKFMILGITPEEVCDKITNDSTVVFIFANQVINHLSLVEIIQTIKKNRPKLPVVILENTQAVTAYALKPVAKELFETGADYILTGEPEKRCVQIAKLIEQRSANEIVDIDGVYNSVEDLNYKENTPKNEVNIKIKQSSVNLTELDELPFPAWDLFPIENYWKLGFAHGPLTTDKYIPLLTSRGCPYPCKFCVIPSTTNRKWRARSAKNVVDEIEYFKSEYGVTEFHLEDLNSTIQDTRIRSICEELISRNLNITWKIVAGTKVESIKKEETIDLMAKSGCKYISISPESGSPEVMKLIDKPFKLDHAVKLVKRMNEVGIYSQACFVLGFPGETAADRKLTRNLVKDLTIKGVDEIALFMISPVPGSEIFDLYEGYNSLSDLNFTPTWREDYKELSTFRL
jgi:anaerobic magnesium-protoporphyrin IX monomethyl ester cyclase